MRVFEDKAATREQTPCMVGLVGPSGTGKTFSALRLATGMQRVSGGDVGVIDTEARRSLHYADRFKFRHLAFGAPFGSLDYLAAIDHFVKQGVKTIIVDSMSHEHEGPGGLLEQHEAETTRLAALWRTKESAAQLAAWGPCKANRRRMINTILQLPINTIFCFRAKEKLKIVKGEDPKPRGYQPIAGEEFLFEMLINFMLLPGCDGHPAWQSDITDEQAMMKLPIQFKEMFSQDVQLSEGIGQALVEWSSGVGGGAPKSPRDVMLASWAKLGVTEEQIVTRFGHSLSEITADERKWLADTGKSIKAGTTTWDAAATVRPPASKAVELSPDGIPVPDHVGREPGDDEELDE
jgi:ABC-type dipeptide/oligopeptide/nickel transport system ATPase subunit